jgi:hypothetical protein
MAGEAVAFDKVTSVAPSGIVQKPGSSPTERPSHGNYANPPTATSLTTGALSGTVSSSSVKQRVAWAPGWLAVARDGAGTVGTARCAWG